MKIKQKPSWDEAPEAATWLFQNLRGEWVWSNREPGSYLEKHKRPSGADDFFSLESDPEPNDMVNHPPHYTSHPSGIECIQVTEHMSFTIGNAVKYLWRADLKNGLEDLKKAAWYIQREIEKREKQK